MSTERTRTPRNGGKKKKNPSPRVTPVPEQVPTATVPPDEVLYRTQDGMGDDDKEMGMHLWTPERIRQEIENVTREQIGLMPRRFCCDPHVRTWTAPGNARSFTVAQFNTLAEGLSSGPNSEPPFQRTAIGRKKKLTNCFGSFITDEPEVCLDFNFRRWRLLEEILNADADIIALEEVDRYDGFFAPMIEKFGYASQFVPKPDATGCDMGWLSDGTAIFYRTSKFRHLGCVNAIYEDGHNSQVYLKMRLKHKASKKTLNILATHLKSKESRESEERRKRQVDQILQEIDEGGAADATIVVGDFNDVPESLPVKTMVTDGRFKSAYNLEASTTEHITTKKSRPEKKNPKNIVEKKRVIDYIFYKGALTCVSTLNVPVSELGTLPSIRYPSDHVLIAAKFNWPAKKKSTTRSASSPLLLQETTSPPPRATTPPTTARDRANDAPKKAKKKKKKKKIGTPITTP